MTRFRSTLGPAAALGLLLCSSSITSPALAQDVASATTDDSATAAPVEDSMSEEELEILVARIALYPDDIIAAILAASAYPLEIIEAQRFLDQVKTDSSVQPKETWDGSVIALLNTPEVIKMMNDDLDWTQDLGTAVAYQQKDLLIAIQQLRDEAIAKGVIETNDKVTVTTENDNVVIQPTNDEVIYLPVYEPEMFYEEGYEWVDVGYGGGDGDSNYWYPDAPYWPGFIAGIVWGGIIDWDNWHTWGGAPGNNWDCNGCFNDIDIGSGNIDWSNIDRDKFNRDNFNRDNFRDSIKNREAGGFRDSIKNNERNNVRDRAATVKRERAAADRKAPKVSDVRKNARDVQRSGERRQANAGGERRQAAGGAETKKKAAKGSKKKPRPAAKSDHRSKNPSALGEVRSGKKAKASSQRGKKSMNSGGNRRASSGGSRKASSGGGRRSSGGGGRGGGRR
jgi:uncharacterized membrane protein YgcG